MHDPKVNGKIIQTNQNPSNPLSKQETDRQNMWDLIKENLEVLKSHMTSDTFPVLALPMQLVLWHPKSLKLNLVHQKQKALKKVLTLDLFGRKYQFLRNL